MWPDNETSEDLLGFKIHADFIKEIVLDDTLLPTTIGLFGDWGSGKSSIMQILKEELVELESDGVICLYFNSWIFEGHDDAKAALIESILMQLENHQSLMRKTGTKIKKLYKSVDWMRVLNYGFKNIAMPITSAYLTGGASLIPQLVQSLKNNPEQISEKVKNGEFDDFFKNAEENKPQEIINSIRKFRDDFEELIEQSDINKLVILIDDLDRCNPERLVENLEAIKLFLNVKKTAFVIGADPRIVSKAVEYKYKDTYKFDEQNSRIVLDYLEKVIQIPYHLPKLSDTEVETYINLLLCKVLLPAKEFREFILSDFNSFRDDHKFDVYDSFRIEEILRGLNSDIDILNEFKFIPNLAAIISDSLYGNPRQIKRFLNTFFLRRKLAKVAKIEPFDYSVLSKLMVLEYSEPRLFEELFKWQNIQSGKPTQLLYLEAKLNNNIEFDAESDIPKTEFEKEVENWVSNQKVISWLKVEPLLNSVDLREYFWLSRDRINSSVSSKLIPPIVKQWIIGLKNALAYQDTVQQVEDILQKGTPLEISKLMEALKTELWAEQNSDVLHHAYIELIIHKVANSLSDYEEFFQKCNLATIPASIQPLITGFELKSIPNRIREIILSRDKEFSSRISKAFQNPS